MMRPADIFFRAWYYFRAGWSIYFAFILSAINTATVTYFLAIERLPALKEIFPSFFMYILIVVGIGVPILIVVGYVHWKKSSARKAEVDIGYETDPYKTRTLVNTEMLIKINLDLIKILASSTNTKMNKEELDALLKSQEQISKFLQKRNFSNKMDLDYIKTETREAAD